MVNTYISHLAVLSASTDIGFIRVSVRAIVGRLKRNASNLQPLSFEVDSDSRVLALMFIPLVPSFSAVAHQVVRELATCSTAVDSTVSGAHRCSLLVQLVTFERVDLDSGLVDRVCCAEAHLAELNLAVVLIVGDKDTHGVGLNWLIKRVADLLPSVVKG